MFLKDFQEIFSPPWSEWITQQIQRTQTYSTDKAVQDLIEKTKTVLSAKGKYIRPALAHVISSAYTDWTTTDLRPGFFLEAFHLFALIHDDIIDKGSMRRGVTTIHTALEQKYKEENRQGDLVHIANSQAILAGDLVYTWALELLQELSHEPYGAQLSQLLFSMIHETVIGQMIDVDLMTCASTDETRLYDKIYFKTASYTFIRPLQVGVIVSQPKHIDAALQSCVAIGKPLGLGFQIQDDLIDIMVPAETSGKNPFTDILDGQHTDITHFIQTQGSPQDIATLERARKEKTIDEKEFKTMIKESGALAYCKEKIETYFSEAKHAIDQSPLPEQAKTDLHDLVLYLEDRRV